MANDTLWQTKLHARLHDPAEKALVLLRDPAGHEGGTSRALQRDLGFHNLPIKEWLDPDNAEVLERVLFQNGIPLTMYRQVKIADWWAAGADRPQWPMEEITFTTKDGQARTHKVADWAQVRWTEKPILIHPLTGSEIDLRSLGDTDIGDIKQRSFDHFSHLIVRNGDQVEWQKTLLAFWRFGPELADDADNGKLGLLWPLLPADTRVPDHSIWDHLDLASAFAGAFAADSDGEAALLALSLGPVQSFIAAARSTSDLWAGSHLLSRLSWEAMRVVCERLGPDAILFPRLRGVPQVDVWLRDAMGLPGEHFSGCDWTRRSNDANPLFAAALPNRFVAVVPRSQAEEMALAVSTHVRTWLREKGLTVVNRLLEAAELSKNGQSPDESVYAYCQMREQLAGFPEVHWATVPFSLIQLRDTVRQTDLDTARLSEAMAPFFGVEAGSSCGFLDSPAWRVLKKEASFEDNTAFFVPKPGVLYPAVYDLVERVLAAAKSTRPFSQTEQKGWRCSLTGETEWLTADRQQLNKSYRRQTDTLWARVAARQPAWAKKGEHLGAIPAIKRLWPTLFAQEVAEALRADRKTADRFVVSTHTMALAGNLEELNNALSDSDAAASIGGLLTADDRAPALPRALAALRDSLAARVPAALDRLRDSEEPGDPDQLRRLEKEIQGLLGYKPEAYYSLILMDGDHMGRILSGDAHYAIPYLQSFHPQVRKGFNDRASANRLIADYGKQRRALSPNRHFAISAALNDFALHVVPEIVEQEHLGRVIYAGGDDVLAMLPVSDLLSSLQRLREAYSGTASADAQTDWVSVRRTRRLVCRDGFAYLRGRLMRMMGGATASCGALVAHHQAPLGAVLRELREAERRAKNEGGRDAFSLAVIKRSGGTLYLTAEWGQPLDLLTRVRAFLTAPGVSRRAVYNSLAWLNDLPADADADMLGALLGYQLERQASSSEVLKENVVPELSRRLAALACSQPDRIDWLRRFLSVAEFLARECRAPASNEASRRSKTSANVR
jgi:CRISPR-associated protein Cmr2